MSHAHEPDWAELTSVDHPDDALEILQGLRIRGVRCRAATDIRGGMLKRPTHRVFVETGKVPMARSALPVIWDAILGEQAVDPQGRCMQCGYDLRHSPGIPVCPECGTDLRSLETRLRLRRG